MPEKSEYRARLDRAGAMKERRAQEASEARAARIEELRHIIWCTAPALNDAHRARAGAGLRALGVRR